MLVTGASAGIGKACAEAFAGEGADLFLVARRGDRLCETADQLAGQGARVDTATMDVRDRAGVAALADRLKSEGRPPDILVNNAGLAAGFDLLHEGCFEDWDRMVDTNIVGLLNVSRAFLPHMVERDSGHVINVGSIAGHQVYPRGNVYNATKFAVRALTEGMYMDLMGTSVRVSSISPGLVETEFATVRFSGDEERARQVYDGLQPLKPEDVAGAVLYAAGLPPHVNALEIIILPTAQRSVHHVHRKA